MSDLTEHWKHREQGRILDLTPRQLAEELIAALKHQNEGGWFTADCVSRLLTQLDQISKILHLCRHCMQRNTANQWARYCYVTCRPHRSVMPLHHDPDGTLRLVYPSEPTARQLRQDAGLDKVPP